LSKPIIIYKSFQTYQNYIDAFYGENPILKETTYKEQRSALIHDGFPWIFSWSTHNTDKNIEIFETVHNCEWLQNRWASEKKLKTQCQIEIIIEQIKYYQPQVCVLYPPELFTLNVRSRIQKSVSHNLIFVSYDGMNRKNVEIYSGFDLIITCSKFISDFYTQKGLLTYTLPFCFDSKILNRINTNVSHQYNIGFSGSIFPNVHNDRYQLLNFLSKHQKISIRSDFATDRKYNLLAKNHIKRLLRSRDISTYFDQARISSMNKGSVYGLDMYQFFNNTKIGLNMHGDKIDFAANVRMYEITGAGSCLLTDWKKNIEEIFIPDKEVITYNSFDEAKDKIKFLLKNDAYRNKIAKAGQRRTLDEYSYDKSIKKLMNFLTETFRL
jgi:spore maturation protein CgeB